MTDENTRLPSDSVVEAWTWQESWPCTAGGNNKLLTKVALEKPDPAMLYVLPETIRPLAALADQPRDDVRERYELALVKILNLAEENSELQNIADAALSQGDEQPDIPDMTEAECAIAYRDLRNRANDAGFATVGEWIDEQPDTDGLAAKLERLLVKWDSSAILGGSRKVFEAFDLIKENRDTIFAALRTDRKAVLEEAFSAARQVAAEKRAHQDYEEDLVAHGAELAASAVRALAEGAGK